MVYPLVGLLFDLIWRHPAALSLNPCFCSYPFRDLPHFLLCALHLLSTLLHSIYPPLHVIVCLHACRQRTHASIQSAFVVTTSSGWPSHSPDDKPNADQTSAAVTWMMIKIQEPGMAVTYLTHHALDSVQINSTVLTSSGSYYCN